jgi:hypothetical protein
MPQARANLSDIIEAIALATDESSAFLDRETGEVVLITDEDEAAADDEAAAARAPDWQQETIALARQIKADADGRFVPLPSRFEIHEWQMMADFAAALDDEAIGRELSRAIRGAGAFRRFKGEARRLGVLEQWYAYRDDCHRQLAIDWCEANGIEWRSDDGSEPQAG